MASLWGQPDLRPTMGRHPARLALAAPLLVGLLLSTAVRSVAGARHYPRLANYTARISRMSEAQLDTLARYDLLVLAARPSLVRRIRARHRDIELLFQWMPQNIAINTANDAIWYPDTTWSLIRPAQFYANKMTGFSTTPPEGGSRSGAGGPSTGRATVRLEPMAPPRV